MEWCACSPAFRVMGARVIFFECSLGDLQFLTISRRCAGNNLPADQGSGRNGFDLLQFLAMFLRVLRTGALHAPVFFRAPASRKVNRLACAAAAFMFADSQIRRRFVCVPPEVCLWWDCARAKSCSQLLSIIMALRRSASQGWLATNRSFTMPRTLYHWMMQTPGGVSQRFSGVGDACGTGGGSAAGESGAGSSMTFSPVMKWPVSPKHVKGTPMCSS
jgi:hypothetical protein